MQNLFSLDNVPNHTKINCFLQFLQHYFSHDKQRDRNKARYDRKHAQ